MKNILLGIAFILFGVSSSLLQIAGLADGTVFEIISVIAPFMGIIFAFIGALTKDNN